MAADDEALDLMVDERAVRADCRRLQQADELGEGLRPAVVRGGRGEDQGVRVGGQHAGEPVVLGGGVGDVVGFVDDHGVPAVLPQVGQVAVRLQGVHRDDHPLVERERVPRGRELLAHALDAHGVQSHERQGEPGPHLVLHLLQHVAWGDDEDAISPSAADELGEDHADLEGLAQAHGVREEDPWAEVGGVQGLADRVLLVAQRVREHLGGDGELVGVQGDGGLAERGLEPEAGGAVTRGRVPDHARLRRVVRLDPVQVLVERGRGVTDQLGEALDRQECAVLGVLHPRDQPLLVPDHHHRTRRNGQL